MQKGKYVSRPAGYQGTNDAWMCTVCKAVWATSDRLVSAHIVVDLPGQDRPVVTPFKALIVPEDTVSAYSVAGVAALRTCPGGNAIALVLVDKLLSTNQHPRENCCTCWKVLGQPCCLCGMPPKSEMTTVQDVASGYPSPDEARRSLLYDDLLPQVETELENITELTPVEWKLGRVVAHARRNRRRNFKEAKS